MSHVWQGDNMYNLMGNALATSAGAYMLLGAILIIPTVWLPDLRALSFLGVFGVTATCTVAISVSPDVLIAHKGRVLLQMSLTSCALILFFGYTGFLLHRMSRRYTSVDKLWWPTNTWLQVAYTLFTGSFPPGAVTHTAVWPTLPLVFGIMTFCYSGHGVFPAIQASMSEPEAFPQVGTW